MRLFWVARDRDQLTYFTGRGGAVFRLRGVVRKPGIWETGTSFRIHVALALPRAMG
jgi:hypothetical protein